jgi:hypothetical protein
MTPRRHFVRIWLLALPLIAGCDFFSMDTTLDDACIAFDQKTIDGAKNGVLERTFAYGDLTVLDGFVKLDADVTRLDVSLHAVAGVTDLSFIDSVRVTLQSGDLPAIDVIRCDGGACASDTMTTEVSEVAPPNLTDYALAGKVQVRITMTGAALPTSAWTANVKMCLSGSAHVAVGI